MICFSDIHLREQSEAVAFRVLDWILRAADADDQRVVFCGDWWHLRYQVNVRLLNRVAAVMQQWKERGIHVDLLPGNHDQVDVGGANALEIFEAFSNVTVWTEPGIRTDERWGFVPYRKDHEAQIKALLDVAAEAPKVIFAHYGIKGAVMNSGRKDQDGIGTPGMECPLVLGHYHKHQQGPGYQYVGSPYQTSYGEAGNVCGCLVNGVFTPIDVGAPKHYIIEWDPAVSDEPPPNPGEPHDHVRLDIKATQEMIVKGKFKTVLKRSGLDQAQVNVVPVPVQRELKLTMEQGESLLHAAERFACERLGTTDLDAPMAALRRWADG